MAIVVDFLDCPETLAESHPMTRGFPAKRKAMRLEGETKVEGKDGSIES